MPLTVERLTQICNETLLQQWNTILVGGFAEPLYLPSANGQPAEIQFKEDFIKSALHELSHWSIAGSQRRNLVDYGYWYSPDGRNPEEQKKFFLAEVKPQAIEKAFSQKCGLDFEVSCDNLDGDTHSAEDKSKFESNVALQLKLYEANGFPPRAVMILQMLESMSKMNSI